MTTEETTETAKKEPARETTGSFKKAFEAFLEAEPEPSAPPSPGQPSSFKEAFEAFLAAKEAAAKKKKKPQHPAKKR